MAAIDRAYLFAVRRDSARCIARVQYAITLSDERKSETKEFAKELYENMYSMIMAIRFRYPDHRELQRIRRRLQTHVDMLEASFGQLLFN